MPAPLTSRSAIVALTMGAFALSGTALYATSHSNADEPAVTIAQGHPPQAMPVQVVTIKQETVNIWKNFSGRMAAVDRAEVRPRVAGVITEVRFTDGQKVTKDDVLFVIDPRPYEAALARAEAEQLAAQTAVAQARAELEAARTSLSFAEREFKRAEGLIQSSTIAQRTYDERANAVQVGQANVNAAQAAVSASRANVTAAQAAVNQAKLDLEYAYVKAPISGRINRAEITTGNMISQGSSPILTSIVSDEGIYADFNVDERTYLNQVRHYARTKDEESNIPVRLITQNGEETHSGFIQAFDNQIDATSGTIRARAYFPNEDHALVPGMFVEIRMASAQNQGRILVDERAIGTNQDRKFVYVVSSENTVEVRPVRLGETIGSRRVVTDGLREGDLVITEGIMRLRPGVPVQPTPAKQAS